MDHTWLEPLYVIVMSILNILLHRNGNGLCLKGLWELVLRVAIHEL